MKVNKTDQTVDKQKVAATPSVQKPNGQKPNGQKPNGQKPNTPPQKKLETKKKLKWKP